MDVPLYWKELASVKNLGNSWSAPCSPHAPPPTPQRVPEIGTCGFCKARRFALPMSMESTTKIGGVIKPWAVSLLKGKPSGVTERIAFKIDAGKGCVCSAAITLNSLAFGNGICTSVTCNSGVQFYLVGINRDRIAGRRKKTLSEAGKKTQARPAKKGKREGTKNFQRQGQRGGRQASRHGPRLTERDREPSSSSGQKQ
eukprot:1161653-Pelagomonas_calceolata.AAC.1